LKCEERKARHCEKMSSSAAGNEGGRECGVGG
jgi:hypothetical protein